MIALRPSDVANPASDEAALPVLAQATMLCLASTAFTAPTALAEAQMHSTS